MEGCCGEIVLTRGRSFVISGNRVRGQRLITTMFQILFALPLSSKPEKSRDYSTLDVHFGFTKAFTYLLLEELTCLLINTINLTKITSKGTAPQPSSTQDGSYYSHFTDKQPRYMNCVFRLQALESPPQ